MQIVSRSIFIKFIVIFTVFILFFGFFSHGIVRAEFVGFGGGNGPIDDFKSDPEFNLTDYPENDDDISLTVIQIAESDEHRLYIYVYKPNQLLLDASAVSVSTSVKDPIYIKYKLQYVGVIGNIIKYRVEDFTVSVSDVRYYALSSIYRPWDELYDEPSANSSTIDEVAYSVEQYWTARSEDSTVNYQKQGLDVVVVKPEDLYAGFIRYNDGFTLQSFWVDRDTASHFVAFSSDRKIDVLQEVRISFDTQLCKLDSSGVVLRWPANSHTCTLSYLDNISSLNPGWGASFNEWSRIQSTEDFCENEINLTPDVKKNIQSKQWVLRYYESEYKVSTSWVDRGEIVSWTETSKITLLQFKFFTDGKSYNVGVVSNSISEDPIPVNKKEVNNDYIWILWLVLAIILLLICMPILPTIMTFIAWGLKGLVSIVIMLFKFVFWLITLPFKLIISLFTGGGKS